MAVLRYRGVLTHGFTVDEKGRQDVEIHRQHSGAAEVDEHPGRRRWFGFWIAATDYANE